jgi:hypothetical protein
MDEQRQSSKRSRKKSKRSKLHKNNLSDVEIMQNDPSLMIFYEDLESVDGKQRRRQAYPDPQEGSLPSGRTYGS